MAAPKGNRFWEKRAKHGRERLFKSPKLLWEACVQYFQWCEDNPLIEIDYVGGAGKKVKKPKMRAFTIQGLCRYLDTNTQWFNQFEESLKNEEREKTPRDEEFSVILTRVREIIYDQKFTGAAAGFLNPMIIARDLSLRDKAEVSGPNGGPIQTQQITGMEIK